MKKLIILIAMVAVATFVKAQGTTEIEYNYITVGYQNQVIKEGGDLKKGYTLKGFFDAGNYKLSTLIRDADGSIAGVMIVFHSEYKDYYFCMPNSKAPSELWDKFFTALDEIGITSAKPIYKLTATFFAAMLDDVVKKENATTSKTK